MLTTVRVVTMSTISKGEQDDDVNMEDADNEVASSSVDVTHKAQDEAVDPPTAPLANENSEDNGDDAKSENTNERVTGGQSNATDEPVPNDQDLEKNNDPDAKSDPTNNFNNDGQSSSDNEFAKPVTEVENNDMDIWDGTIGEDPEKLNPDDLLIIKLQDENLALENHVTTLENQISVLTNKIAMLDNQVGILEGEKDNVINSANGTTRELKDLISNQHIAIINANNRITAEHNSNVGKQHQLDSLYATLRRQEQHLNYLYVALTRQEQQIHAQAAHINTIKNLHDKELRRIGLEVSKMVRSSEQKFERHVLAQRRFAAEVDRLIINIEDPEATEDEAEAEAGEEQEVEVIDLVDEDDGDDDGFQTAGGDQHAVVEQLGQVQQVMDDEQDLAIQQLSEIEQHAEDATQVTAGEESPSKRVKLTKQA